MESVSSDRPATFEAAFAADGEAPAVESQTTQPVESTPVESTTPAATAPATETPQTDLTPAGPIPLERHKAILDGAYRERDTVKQQLDALQQQAGWLESAEGRQLRQWGETFRTNPREWFAKTVADLVQVHPELATSLRSDAARLLATGRSAPEVNLEPDIPVLNDQGQVVSHAYSADRAKAVFQQMLRDELQKEVGPLRSSVEQAQAERAVVATQREAEHEAQRQYTEAVTWEGFKEHEQAIAALWAQHEDWSLERAYINVVPAKIRAAESSKTLERLKTTAAASTGAPTHAASGTPRRPTSLTDPSLSWE